MEENREFEDVDGGDDGHNVQQSRHNGEDSPQEYVTFSKGMSSCPVLLNQEITASQVAGMFGLSSDAISLTQDGPRPRIRIFAADGIFKGLRAGNHYFVDMLDSPRNSDAAGVASPRPVAGFRPIPQARGNIAPGQVAIQQTRPSAAAAGVRITVVLGEWGNRGKRIESCYRQLSIDLTAATANIDYIKQAVRSYFDDEALEVYTSNNAMLEDCETTTGLDAWRRRTTPRTRYWACPPPPSRKRTHSGDGAGSSNTTGTGASPTGFITQDDLNKSLKMVMDKMDSLASTSSQNQPPNLVLACCSICYGPLVPCKACVKCGKPACGGCIDRLETEVNDSFELCVRCPFCNRNVSFIEVRDLVQ